MVVGLEDLLNGIGSTGIGYVLDETGELVIEWATGIGISSSEGKGLVDIGVAIRKEGSGCLKGNIFSSKKTSLLKKTSLESSL